MPRVSDAQNAARREQVATLWVRGVPLAKIARTVGCDWQTAQRDVRLLARKAAEELDVPRELSRLLLAGQAVEVDCWTRGQPLQALAAQKQQLAVLSVLLGMDTARRVEALERRFEELTAVPIGTGSISVNGHAGGGKGWPT